MNGICEGFSIELVVVHCKIFSQIPLVAKSQGHEGLVKGNVMKEYFV